MDLQLKNKRALVCAASEGLGFAIAQALAAEGATILLVSSQHEKLASAVNRLAAQNPQAKILSRVANLTVLSEVEDLASYALEQLKGVDILINNVGGPPPSAAATTSAQDWQRGFERLFLSATTLTTKLLPSMSEQKFGRIITVTSISVLEPIDNLAISTAMRAAVTGYSKALAREVAPLGITVNTLMPGIIHTKRIENLRNARAQREGTTLDVQMRKTIEEIPAQRLGRPEELGVLAAFLASPLAGYVTGQNIGVDGGLRRGWN